MITSENIEHAKRDLEATGLKIRGATDQRIWATYHESAQRYDFELVQQGKLWVAHTWCAQVALFLGVSKDLMPCVDAVRHFFMIYLQTNTHFFKFAETLFYIQYEGMYWDFSGADVVLICEFPALKGFPSPNREPETGFEWAKSPPLLYTLHRINDLQWEITHTPKSTEPLLGKSGTFIVLAQHIQVAVKSPKSP